MASVSNPNGLRVVTGGGAGTLDMQFVLIRCYNSAFTITATSQDPYEYISNPDDGFAQIISVIQNYAEIYYIGIPEANSGSESDLTRIVVAVNPVTAQGLPLDYTYPTAEGRWTLLEEALDAQIGGGGSLAYFGMPGVGWNWFYDQ
jgi:hypothetical protein